MSISGVIRAGTLKIGDQLAEADGFLWDVAEIVETTDTAITVRLCSDFSNFSDHWTQKPDGKPGGVRKTFKKDDMLRGIPAVSVHADAGLSQEVKAVLQMFIDTDLEIHGEVTGGTLEAISVQGFVYRDGELRKAVASA